MEIDLLVLQAAPQPLDEDVVHPAAAAVHADGDAGGGLLAEPMTWLGACVTGSDAVERNIAVARLHAERSGLAIVGAEYVLGWLPRGTHDWRNFVPPSEPAAGLRPHGVEFAEITGVSYNPLADRWSLSRDLDVNYLVLAKRSR